MKTHGLTGDSYHNARRLRKPADGLSAACARSPAARRSRRARPRGRRGAAAGSRGSRGLIECLKGFNSATGKRWFKQTRGGPIGLHIRSSARLCRCVNLAKIRLPGIEKFGMIEARGSFVIANPSLSPSCIQGRTSAPSLARGSVIGFFFGICNAAMFENKPLVRRDLLNVILNNLTSARCAAGGPRVRNQGIG